MKGNRCVLIGGADIADYEYAKGFLTKGDFCIFCDSGLRHSKPLGITPDLIVGDFDSCENPGMAVETIVLPREKDDTDSFFAAKEGVRRGFADFLLLGVIGGRLDHTLANLSVLLYLDSRGKRGVAIDDHSQIELISEQPAYITDEWSYFSLLSIGGDAQGVTVENAKYCLDRAKIGSDFAYGISNEVIPGKTARVSVEQGRLLLIRVRQE